MKEETSIVVIPKPPKVNKKGIEEMNVYKNTDDARYITISHALRGRGTPPTRYPRQFMVTMDTDGPKIQAVDNSIIVDINTRHFRTHIKVLAARDKIVPKCYPRETTLRDVHNGEADTLYPCEWLYKTLVEVEQLLVDEAKENAN